MSKLITITATALALVTATPAFAAVPDPTAGLFVMLLVTTAVMLGIYFIPTVVALARGHHQMVAIVLLNLFTGWTFIGWVAALVWAATATKGATA